jgi:hypothetical protein
MTMSTLTRRLARLEQARPAPSPWDATDPIFASLEMSELISLVTSLSAGERGMAPSAEDEAVYGMVRDRIVAAGVSPR